MGDNRACLTNSDALAHSPSRVIHVWLYGVVTSEFSISFRFSFFSLTYYRLLFRHLNNVVLSWYLHFIESEMEHNEFDYLNEYGRKTRKKWRTFKRICSNECAVSGADRDRYTPTNNFSSIKFERNCLETTWETFVSMVYYLEKLSKRFCECFPKRGRENFSEICP